MAREFAEFHDELRSVAGDLLAKDRAVDWRRSSTPAGSGLEVPDELGGAGATFAEVAVDLRGDGPRRQREQLPRRRRAGRRRLECAGSPATTRDDCSADVAVRQAPSRLAVVGSIRAGRVRARRRGRRPDSGRSPTTAASSSLEPRLTVTPQPVLDETRRLATVVGDGRCRATIAASSTADPDRRACGGCSTGRRSPIACDSLGLCEAMLAATVAYAKVRHQFGRPIGSFQAVKHACADMLVSICRRPPTRRRRGRRRRGRPTGRRRRGVAWRSRTPAARPSTSPARPCNCTAASDTRGRAASTSISSAPRSTVRCSAHRRPTANN